MSDIEIKSNFKFGSRLNIDYNDSEIKAEPMLWRADAGFARSAGGLLTNAFVVAIEPVFGSDFIIDSRVHMLMPGMWPCIPGWHHDDVPRTRSDGQPNYRTPEYKSEHVSVLFGDASLTEFAVGDSWFPDVAIGRHYYREWHDEVEERIAWGQLRRVVAPEATPVYFDWNTWHQGVRATKRGWRLFIRATKGSNLKARNEIRNQVQVYMDDPYYGW